ncbi:unnamed protein product [Schistocephalus solidus]|uniref:Delta-like protein n=1 Tax=Schistocephalus solidus TaxID=70667 RepID=A0A183S792_SCHSO|nr:unnamed protein product [Schistocephalus solidus]
MPHDRKCDVYFKICISTAGTEECDVYSHTTEVYFEHSSVNLIGEKAIITFLSEPVPPAVDIQITAMDSDDILADDVIGVFDAKTVVFNNSQNFIKVPLTKRGRLIPSLNLNLKMKFQCMSNYYGQHCEIYCESDAISYRCSNSGERICMQDPECYPSDDPCSELPCKNSGICVKSEGTTRGFVCQCPLFWWGDFCEKHISPCSLAEQIETRAREYSSSTRNRSVCLNGGICIDHPTKFDYFCKCPSGWSGNRCEQQVSSGV